MVLDKPTSLSSAQAVARVKRLLGVRKIGHTGTLDPFATGVLICCINQATRLARFLLRGNKTYRGVLRLGIETDTQDATGRVIRRTDVPALETERLTRIINGFVGEQMQMPPVYAALKHEGTPLYKLARKGRPVQKPARRITVSAINVRSVELPDVDFEVTCSSGTYVRTLCADIGAALGCGGHLKKLRRTANSGFFIDQAITLEALKAMEPSQRQEKTLISMATALGQMPTFIANEEMVKLVRHGRPLNRQKLPPALIQRPSHTVWTDYVKVVDGKLDLKAVLKITPDSTTYDYCCVFN